MPSNTIRWDAVFDPSVNTGDTSTCALFTQAVSTVINALAAALVSGQQQQQDTKVMSMLREVMGVMKGAEGVMVNTGQEVRDALTAQMKCVECAVVDAMHTQAQEVKDSVVTSIAAYSTGCGCTGLQAAADADTSKISL